MGIGLLVLALAALAFARYFQWRQEQERHEALAELADRLGFRVHPYADAEAESEYEKFEIFRRGHSRTALNTLVGEIEMDGRPCAARCGDFRYLVSRGNGQTTEHAFSYLMVSLPWHTPPLLIRPEGMFDRIAEALGFDDINFESDEFSRRYFVKSPNRKFAYDVIHPRMMEFLLAERPPMLDLEHGAICCSDGARRWDLGTYEATIVFLRRFFALWPRHLLDQAEERWDSSSSLPS